MESIANVVGIFNSKINKIPSCSNEHILLLNSTKSYSAIASCLLEHIITNNNLTESERLYYVYVDLKANYNLSKKRARNTAISAATSAKQLNLSKSTIFRLQDALQNKGYLSIKRGNHIYDVNVVTPTLPKAVFDLLITSPSRINTGVIKSTDCYRSYLDSDKMFIPLNYQQIDLLINTKDLTGLQKLIWLFLYVRSFLAQQSSEKRRSTITQTELCEIFKCSQSTVSKALINLSKLGFINKNRYDIKSQTQEESYSTRSVFFIEALFPLEAMEALLANQADRKKIEHNIEQLEALRTKIRNRFKETENSQMHHGYSEMSDVNSQISHRYSEMRHISNKNNTLKTFSNKNINNKNVTDFDVFVKNNDLYKTPLLNSNISSTNIIEQEMLKSNEHKAEERTEVNIKTGRAALQAMLQKLKGTSSKTSNQDNNDSNQVIEKIDIEIKKKIDNELKQAQAHRIDSLFSDYSTAILQQATSQESTLIKELTTNTFQVSNNDNSNIKQLETQESKIIAVVNEEIEQEWTLSVDIINAKLESNVLKLTKEQVLKATNFAKKLKREVQSLPKLRGIDEGELANQFIHHAANFKMTSLKCKTRSEEVDAALSFAWRAVTRGTWTQPAGWAVATELHLKREKLRYEDDCLLLRKLNKEIKIYLAAS